MGEIDTAIPKGENLVGYCPICGVNFEETMSTNRYCKCDSCESIFQVKTKSELIDD